MLRNFPHQVNRIAKIRGALRVASDLLNAGENISDDALLGHALARAGVYKFRGLDSPTPAELEAAIQLDKSKAQPNQGPRTFSRDLRRTLQLLGFLARTSTGWRVTQLGQDVLSLPDPPDSAAASLWTEAVLQLELTEGGVIHPSRNMLRMVQRHPGIEKKWLALALEMKDDSDSELARVQGFQGMGFTSAVSSVGATSYKAANAVKILPLLLEQLGLLSIDRAVCNLTTLGVASLEGLAGGTTAIAVPASAATTPRRRRTGYEVADAGDVRDLAASPGRPRTTEEQLHSAALLEERTSQHQELVRRVVSRMKNVSEVRCSDDAFDVFGESSLRSEGLLIEAKTLRGDALVQARIALGQLLYYEHFDIRPATSEPIIKIVAFDSEPGDQARQFLAAYSAESLVVTELATIAPDSLLEYFVDP